MRPQRPEHAEFSERLKEAREHAGFKSAREASQTYEWNDNTYKSRENSLRGIPDYAEVRRYARAFKVPFVWLLTGEGDAPKWARLQSVGAKQALVNEAEPAYNRILRRTDSIQVEVGLLRSLLIDALTDEGLPIPLPAPEAEAYADAFLVSLEGRQAASVVVRLEVPRSAPGLARPGLVDPS